MVRLSAGRAARLGLALLSVGCAGPVDKSPASGPDTAEPVLPDDGAARLARASLDLRGHRPSPAELAAAADGAEADRQIAAWLEDAALGARVAALWAPTWGTAADQYLVAADQFGPYEEAALMASLGQQPTRLIQRLVEDGLPWSTFATAEWTVVDELLLDLLPVEAEDEPARDGWVRARWTDGRPPLGAFGSPGFYLRTTSTEFNAQRSRANAISRIALCDDFLDRDVPLGTGATILDQEAAINAMRDDPGCQACHDALDPVAAHLWGFHQMFDGSPSEYLRYHAEREFFWQTWGGGVGPSFEGQPSDAAADLGPALASSGRFSRCAASQTRALLLLDPAAAAEAEGTDAALAAYTDSGGDLRAVIASVLQDPAYRGVGQASAGGAGRRLLTGERMERALSALVDVHFTIDGWGLSDNDRAGLRTLAGPADLHSLAAGPPTPSPTQVLVQGALAEAVAGLAIGPSLPGGLFEIGDLEADLDDDAWAARHAELSLRALSRPPAPGELAADRALYAAARAAGASPAEAWQAVLTALLLDPAAVWG